MIEKDIIDTTVLIELVDRLIGFVEPIDDKQVDNIRKGNLRKEIELYKALRNDLENIVKYKYSEKENIREFGILADIALSD